MVYTRMANLELALLLEFVCGRDLGRKIFRNAADSFQPEAGGPETIVLRGDQLLHLRKLRSLGDEQVQKAVDYLVSKAHEGQTTRFESVRDKPEQAVGNPNDYVSLAKYWWPISGENEQIEFVRRDGQVNPECFSENYDFIRFTRMATETFDLSLASYLSGDKELGSKASQMLRVWFLDPWTAQSPHFEYAQVIPGKPKLSGRGIVEARFLIQVLEASKILVATGQISTSEERDLKDWFGQLLHWLQSSEKGRMAAESENNITLWYWSTCYVISKFLDDAILSQKLMSSYARAIVDQVSLDGSLESELVRERPHDYTAFSILGISVFEAAADKHMAQKPSIEVEAGQALTKARDWLGATVEAREIRNSVTELVQQISFESTDQKSFETLLLARSLSDSREMICKQADELTVIRDQLVQAQDTLDKAKQLTGQLSIELEDTKKQLSDAVVALSMLSDVTKNAKILDQKQLRLKRQRLLLAIPYVIASAPISIPYLYWRNRKKKKSSLQTPSPKRKLFAQTLKSFSLPLSSVSGSRHPDEFYGASPVDQAPDTFVLYRIIGNDLYPRHSVGQSRRNVKFILENELSFENCEKRWIVNRIVNRDEERSITELLEGHKQKYSVISFDSEAYKSIGWSFEEFDSPDFFCSGKFVGLDPEQKVRSITAAYSAKNRYIMNNNGARNSALQEGRSVAKWVLPWDGNCFLTPRAWEEISNTIKQEGKRRYFVVPMQRITDNSSLLKDDFSPDPKEEPQIIFRSDSTEMFNPSFVYGRRSKVETFWRLGVPGVWDRWKDDQWDQTRRGVSPEAGLCSEAGWVARLASGVDALEQQGSVSSFKNRGNVRASAILSTIDKVDSTLTGSEGFPCFYRVDALSEVKSRLDSTTSSAIPAIVHELVSLADLAVSEGVFSVCDKISIAPSGYKRDYWHPAPYWWPDPKSSNGLPFVYRDGERVPGTQMYDDESNKYDRTALQKMFDHTLFCALSAFITDRQEHADHGAALVKRWFIDPDSRMNPNLNYAQVKMGHKKNQGSAAGLIEFKDLYFFLDAVTLLERMGSLSSDDSNSLRTWLSDYRTWLIESSQGQAELVSKNNHGTYFDLQMIAIAAFLGDSEAVRTCYFRSLSRLNQQISAVGKQPEELKRTMSQHYVVFNLQGFLNIFRIAQSYGRPLLGSSSCGQDRLKLALQWVLSQDHAKWKYRQISVFDTDRLVPLIHSSLLLGVLDAKDLPKAFRNIDFLQFKPKFDPHDAVNPFWNIGQFQSP